MDNVGRIMETVEQKQRQKVLEHMVALSIIIASIKKKFSDISEREAAYVDIYVNCHDSSSWEEIASLLFMYEQVVAVDEVKSFLPPRGEPCLCTCCSYKIF